VPWVSDAELRDAVGNALRSAGASLPAHWTGIVERANNRAYQRIRRVLAGKGFALADLDAWSERESFNLEGGICYAFRTAKLPDGADAGALKDFCEVWKELDELAILLDDAGEEILPSSLDTNLSFGPYDTADDTFTTDTTL
jgi:hypothetical protein